jgi:predicted PurR-regulated permease PerM
MPPSHASNPALTRLVGVLASGVLLLLVLYLGRVFFITLITAILLAFILDPFVVLLGRARFPRSLSSFLACSLLLGVLYLLGIGLWRQSTDLIDDIPLYSKRIADLVDAASTRVEAVEKAVSDTLVPKRMRDNPPVQPPAPTPAQRRRKAAATPVAPIDLPVQPPLVQEVRIHQEDSPVVNYIKQNLSRFYDAALMASFVPFLVYFMLSWRDHFRRGMLQVVSGDHRTNLERAWDGIAGVARAYLVGNFLLGLLMSFLSAMFFLLVKVPYWSVVGPVSAFLSLVPYIGLPLAVLPPFLVSLPVYNGLPAYLLIGSGTALLHLVALNLLYPKFVGARVHLNPLVVTVALMLWYLLWGGAGLVLAIPITAGLKAAFDNIPSLKAWGRLLGD